MKFCDIKMGGMQAKAAKAGMYAPGEMLFAPQTVHFHVTLRARRKNKPDIVKGLARTPPATRLRPFPCRICFFATRRIHKITGS
jgi:hypothetical protein